MTNNPYKHRGMIIFLRLLKLVSYTVLLLAFNFMSPRYAMKLTKFLFRNLYIYIQRFQGAKKEKIPSIVDRYSDNKLGLADMNSVLVVFRETLSRTCDCTVRVPLCALWHSTLAISPVPRANNRSAWIPL